MLTPERLDTPELLDEHDAPRADMERSLRDLRRINRFLGGTRVYRRLLRQFAPVRSVADIGAGTADLLDALPPGVKRVAVDFNIHHLRYLRGGSRAYRVVGDATRLPLRDDAVDVVTSSHFFHHFTPEDNVCILREALRAARAGVAVNDTRRHYAPLLTIWLLAALRLVGRITRFDGPASVRRGYTVAEATAIVSRVDAGRARVMPVFPFRLGILLWKRERTS
jgi:hypothetical protein